MGLVRAEGGLSFKVLPDEIRKRFNGTLNYVGADTNDKWVYKKLQATYTASGQKIFATTDEFLGITSSDALVLTNKVRWIMIKHTGYSDINEKSVTSIGVMITFTGADPVFDSDDDDSTPMFLSGGDTMVLKVPVSQADDWRIRTCRIEGGIPSANGSSGDTAILEVAAIIDDDA